MHVLWLPKLSDLLISLFHVWKLLDRTFVAYCSYIFRTLPYFQLFINIKRYACKKFMILRFLSKIGRRMFIIYFFIFLSLVSIFNVSTTQNLFSNTNGNLEKIISLCACEV